VRVLAGNVPEKYGAVYRQAQSAIAAEVPAQFHLRARAFLLLKEHGQKVCKGSKPKCDCCPVRDRCAYFAEMKKRSGRAT
jgi:endonuclease III